MDILPGQLVFLVVVATIDAALLGWLTLRWYQRTVARLMTQAARQAVSTEGREDSTLPDPAKAAGTTPELPAGAPRRGEDGDARAVRRIVLAYVIGALIFSAVISAAMIADMGGASPLIGATLVWIYSWPIVPSLGLLLAWNRRQTLAMIVGYLAAGAVTVAAMTVVSQSLRGAIDDAPLTNIYWAARAMLDAVSAGVVLVAITAWRPVRLVMPLALATSLTFGLALVITPRLVAPAFEIAAIRDAVLAVPALSSGVWLYYATVLLVALPLGWCAWRLLNGLASAFAGKRFSDAQLVVDCWWAIVAAVVSVTELVGPFGIGGLAIGAGAFVGYRAGVSFVLRATGIGTRHGTGQLLLLRVFGHQVRTEAFFDAIAQRWRLRGPVHLIGAADLATRTTDPGDILAFVDGRLGDQFVASRTDIPRRLASLDMTADPDGRFRVNEIYCHDAVWRETLVDLLQVADVVVMDLREFGRENRGCIFELEQLFTRLPPDRIVLICDASTDRELLREVLTGARPEAVGGSETLAARSIVSVERNSPRELDAVMRRLLHATAQSLPA